MTEKTKKGYAPKLNKTIAQEIRRKHNEDHAYVDDLSKEYKITKGSIKDILNNIRYKDPNYKGSFSKLYFNNPKNKKITAPQSHKLDFASAVEIRDKYHNQNISKDDITKEYDVRDFVIISILNNETYYDENYKGKYISSRGINPATLNTEIAAKIRQDHIGGTTYNDLVKQYGVNKNLIKQVIRNEIFIDQNYKNPNKTDQERMEIATNIRNDFANNVSKKELAKNYGMHPDKITKVLCNEKFYDENYTVIYEKEGKKLSMEKAKEIRKAFLEEGIKVCDLAKKYDIDTNYISHVIYNETYYDPNYTPPPPNAARFLQLPEVMRRFKEKHGDKYNYSKMVYVNLDTPIEIGCPKHNFFFQTPSLHFGHGCFDCGHEININSIRHDNQYVDTFISDNLITIKRLENYVDNSTKISFQCLVCDYVFDKKPRTLFEDCSGCPECFRNNKYKNEALVGEFFKKHNIKYERKTLKINDRTVKPDYYVPQWRFFCEINGLHHYKPFSYNHKNPDPEQAKINFERQKLRDISLRQYCLDNDFILLEIDLRKYSGSSLVKFLYQYFEGFINEHDNISEGTTSLTN